MKASRQRNIHEAKRLIEDLPAEMRELVLSYVDDICDLAERLQVPPRATAAAMTIPIGTLAMVQVHGNVHDERGINTFRDFACDAVDVGVAIARLKGGWTPGGPS